MDPIFITEIVIVGLIIVAQIWIFLRNLQAIGHLGELFPSNANLEIQETEQVDVMSASTVAIPQLKDRPGFSAGFRDILQMTNDYLRRNKGTSEGERLEHIASRKSDSMESAIETNLPLPLYIGLLATFTGVIIGLAKIVLDEDISADAIQSFLGGVVIGMIGSASGLALTVRANQVFRERKEDRDHGMESYFQFLRTQVIHPEAAPVQGNIKDLRHSLAAFQGGFVQYQDQMNTSLGDTLRLFRELKDVFKQIRSVEQELSGIGKVIRSNDELIDKQTDYLESYSKKAEAFTRKLGESFQNMDKQVETMVSENIRALEKSTKSAYVKMDQYLASLEGSDSQAFARALSTDLAKINDEIKTLQEKSFQINSQLLNRLNKEDESRAILVQTVSKLDQRLNTVESRSVMQNPIVQTFVYTGIAAFLMGIGGGIVFLVQSLGG
ncbi:MAG: hypothetical protein AAF206_17145 [Bacteroidota bacterium]